MEKEKLSLTRQSQILIIGQAISFSFNFLVPIVVIRYLDMTQYGTYKQLFLIFMTISVMLPFGVVESLYYFIPRNREYKEHYITQTIWFLMLGGVLYLLMMLVFGESILSYLNLSHLYKYSIPLSLYIVFMCVSLPFERLLIIEEHVKASSTITVISEILKGLCILSVTILTRNLKLIMYALVVFSFFRVLVFFYFVYKNRLFIFFVKNMNAARIKEHINYSFPFGMGVLVGSIRRFLHQYFVTAIFTVKDFAIYAAGSFQIPLMNIIYISVSNVVLIRISEYQKHRRYDKILEIWVNSARKLALIYFPVAVLFIVSSREFITLIFTDRYIASVPIFIVTLLQLPLDVFITHSILKAFAQTGFIFKLNLVLLIITAVLLYFFINFFGMVGATLATVFSLALIRIVEILKIRRLMNVSINELIPWRILIKILLACLFCSTVTLLLKAYIINYATLYIFFMEAFSFISLYCLMVYNSKLLTGSEKESIKGTVRKIGLIPTRFL